MLRSLPLGTGVQIDGPFGNFTLRNNESRPAVLLAGGIGITPFRSIVRRAAHENLGHRILLFYANGRPEDAPFLDELYGLEPVSCSKDVARCWINAASCCRPGSIDR